jgi:putative ABC transport system permease protein
VLVDRDLSAEAFEGVQLGLETNRVYVPLSTALTRFASPPLQDELDRLLVRLESPEGIEAGARTLSALLRLKNQVQRVVERVRFPRQALLLASSIPKSSAGGR